MIGLAFNKKNEVVWFEQKLGLIGEKLGGKIASFGGAAVDIGF